MHVAYMYKKGDLLVLKRASAAHQLVPYRFSPAASMPKALVMAQPVQLVCSADAQRLLVLDTDSSIHLWSATSLSKKK